MEELDSFRVSPSTEIMEDNLDANGQRGGGEGRKIVLATRGPAEEEEKGRKRQPHSGLGNLEIGGWALACCIIPFAWCWRLGHESRRVTVEGDGEEEEGGCAGWSKV